MKVHPRKIKWLHVTTVVASLIFCATVTRADTFWYTDAVNDNVELTTGSMYSFQHSILDEGFNPATDLLSSAKITLSFWDDESDSWWVLPSLEFGVLGLGGAYQLFEVDTGGLSFDLNVALLQSDGRLNLSILDLSGDFWFKGSELVASGNSSRAVPEPASLLLMGVGLVGLAKLVPRRRPN